MAEGLRSNPSKCTCQLAFCFLIARSFIQHYKTKFVTNLKLNGFLLRKLVLTLSLTSNKQLNCILFVKDKLKYGRLKVGFVNYRFSCQSTITLKKKMDDDPVVDTMASKCI